MLVEYIWLDGDLNIRSKTRILESNNNLPNWSYDGSSTGQATTECSEVILKPQTSFKDPFRLGDSLLVICDTYDIQGNNLPSNHRFTSKAIFDNKITIEPWFGLEQEYVIYDNKTSRPVGWGSKDPESQGPYYCSHNNKYGRWIVEEHLEKCLVAGIKISGINAEVMPSQWEFQIGPCEGILAADNLIMARYLLEKIADKYNCSISYKGRPESNLKWNGSGCHINYSSKLMREEGGYDEIKKAIEKLALRHQEHLKYYGDNSERLSGTHETPSATEFTFGIADRTSSIRIPYFVPIDGKGYFEDRRPSADLDPYFATVVIFETIHL
jgi:glutamine synthetase